MVKRILLILGRRSGFDSVLPVMPVPWLMTQDERRKTLGDQEVQVVPVVPVVPVMPVMPVVPVVPVQSNYKILLCETLRLPSAYLCENSCFSSKFLFAFRKKGLILISGIVKSDEDPEIPCSYTFD